MIAEQIVLLLFMCDMFFTHNYLEIYRDKFPTKDWTLVEANPLIRNLVKNVGLNQGIVLSGLIIFVFLLILLWIGGEKSTYFLMGLYFMVDVYHFVQLRAIENIKLKGGKNGKKEKTS